MIDKRLNIVWAARRKDKHNRFRLTSWRLSDEFILKYLLD